MENEYPGSKNVFVPDNIPEPTKVLNEYIGLSGDEIKKQYSSPKTRMNSFPLGEDEYVLEVEKSEGTFSFLISEGVCIKACFFDNEE